MKNKVKSTVIPVIAVIIFILTVNIGPVFADTKKTDPIFENKGEIPVTFMFYDKLVYRTSVYGTPGETTTKREIYDYVKKNNESDLAGYTFANAANGGQPVQFPSASTHIPDSKAIQIMVVLDGTPLASQSRIDLIFYTTHDEESDTSPDFMEDSKRKTKVIDRQTVKGTPGEALAEDVGAWLVAQAYTIIDGDKYEVEKIEGAQTFPKSGSQESEALHIYLKRIGPASEEELLRKEYKRLNSTAVLYLVDQKDKSNPLGGVTVLGESGKPIDTVKLSQELKRDLSYRKVLMDYEYIETLDSQHLPIDQKKIVYPPSNEEGVVYVMVFKNKGFHRPNQEVGTILWPTPFTGDRSPVATGVVLCSISLILLVLFQNRKNETQ